MGGTVAGSGSVSWSSNQLETPIGTITIEVNNEKVSFEIKDSTFEPWTLCDEPPETARQFEREPTRGRPDKTLEIMLDTLSLNVGDTVKIVLNCEPKLVGRGSGECLYYHTFEKDGHTVALGIIDDEDRDSGVPWAFELMDLEGEYRIANNPAACNRVLRTIRACVAWRNGTSAADREIVEMAVFMGTF